MFKCSECGNEYQTAPKYCECGNDIFIDVEDKNEFVPQEIDEDIEPIIQTSKYHSAGRSSRRKSLSPVSLCIFGFFIILSLLVLFVIGNPKKDISKSEIKAEADEKVEIPSIDSYWDNTVVKIAEKEEPKEQKQENILDKIVSQIIPSEQPKKEIKTASVSQKPQTVTQKTSTSGSKAVVQKTSQKTQTQTQKQTTSKTASGTSSAQSGMTFGDLTNKIRNQYGVQTSASTQTSAQTQTQPPTQTQKQAQTANQVQSAPVPQSTLLNHSKTTSQTTVATSQSTQTQAHSSSTSVKSQTQLKQELASYKSGLRNAIGRKIDFTKVIGDGDCALSFKINSNGRLISKAFTKQSSNITLNDAAFNALNTMTSYNPPPEGYNGETLRMNIKFYNGNFEISLN